ncbi:hypothetical protein D3C80_545740 [compost metagenome]
MQNRNDRVALPSVQIAQEIEKLDLVGDVEKGRRLIEQKKRRFLRKHHGDPHTLALPAGKLVNGALGKLFHPCSMHRP